MIKYCVICNKTFECYDRAGKQRGIRGIGKRSSKAVTCSKKCALVYRRVSQDRAKVKKSKNLDKLGDINE